MQKIKVERKTKETDIRLALSLAGTDLAKISTGIGFFDHVLNLFVFHGCFDLNLSCKGDLEIDAHHTVEDVGISLGAGFKKGVVRKQRYRSVWRCLRPYGRIFGKGRCGHFRAALFSF